MSDRIQIGQLQIHSVLHDLIANEIAPGTGVDPQQFWVDLEKILTEFMPRNKILLAFRDELQEKIDAWHLERAGQPIDEAEYTAFLRDIGYILMKVMISRLRQTTLMRKLHRWRDHNSLCLS